MLVALIVPKDVQKALAWYKANKPDMTLETFLAGVVKPIHGAKSHELIVKEFGSFAKISIVNLKKPMDFSKGANKKKLEPAPEPPPPLPAASPTPLWENIKLWLGWAFIIAMLYLWVIDITR
jgi:hypothetical protein